MAKIKLEVDMSELNEAIEKANRLIAMLSDIEKRFERIEPRGAGCSPATIDTTSALPKSK